MHAVLKVASLDGVRMSKSRVRLPRRPGHRPCTSVLLLTVLVVAGALSEAQAQCLDYGQYFHRASYMRVGQAGNVAIVGSYAYVSSGNLQVVDNVNTAHPRVVGSVSTPGDARAVVVSGSYAYVADGSAGLQVFEISDPENPSIVGSVGTPGDAWALAVSGPYAFVTDRDFGVHVIEISDPETPSVVGSVATPGSARAVVASGSYAYVADGGSGMQVIEVSDPGNPQIVGSVDTPGSASAVALSGAYACVTDSRARPGRPGFRIIDISDPQDPQIVGSVDTEGGNHWVAISGTYAYMATAQLGECPDGESPRKDDETTPHGSAVILAGPKLQVVDISDPQNPHVVESVATRSILGLAVSGDRLYFTEQISCPDNRSSPSPPGLAAFDIANPRSPQIVSRVLTPGSSTDVTISGSHAYVADGASGLQVIDISDLRNPQIVGSVDTPGDAVDVTVSGSHAFVADGASGLQVIDISDPWNPRTVGSVLTPGDVMNVTVSGSHAFVAAGRSGGLQVIDVSDPRNPQIVGSVDTPGNSQAVVVSDSYAYVTAGDPGLQVIDISDPSRPSIVGSVDTPGNSQAVMVSGSYAYVTDGTSRISRPGFRIIQISDPTNPRIVGTLDSPSNPVIAAISGNYAYVVEGAFGLQVIDISDPSRPSIVGGYTAGSISSVASSGTHLYMTGSIPGESSLRGLRILPMHCESVLLQATLDVRPGACPNPINRNVAHGRGRAVLPAAILGTSDFDVRDIDPASVTLNGASAVRWSYGDVAAPPGEPEDDCSCSASGPDRHEDLILQFHSADVAATLNAGDAAPAGAGDGDRSVVSAEGQLEDGSRFQGSDCVVLVGRDVGPEGPKAAPSREVVLTGNHPNPFSPSTRISFYLPVALHVRLDVFNVLGQRVTTLVDRKIGAGDHSVTWSDSRAAPGIYYYRLQAAGQIGTGKMLLLK